MMQFGGNDTAVWVLYHEGIQAAPRGATVRVPWPRKITIADSRN